MKVLRDSSRLPGWVGCDPSSRGQGLGGGKPCTGLSLAEPGSGSAQLGRCLKFAGVFTLQRKSETLWFFILYHKVMHSGAPGVAQRAAGRPPPSRAVTRRGRTRGPPEGSGRMGRTASGVGAGRALLCTRNLMGLLSSKKERTFKTKMCI